ncbi:MAG: hypothetical protein PHX21_13145 [bacterium]|nr:hypothetical protein [bacterium]
MLSTIEFLHMGYGTGKDFCIQARNAGYYDYEIHRYLQSIGINASVTNIICGE